MIVWKDVSEYPDIFSISNDGKLFSKRTNRILKTRISKQGYEVVSTKINGKNVGFRIHRLVAIAFILNPENKPEVNHKDGNKLNNNESNLEWTTSSENSIHAIETGLQVNSKGDFANSAKITFDIADEIRELRFSNCVSVKKLAEMFNISDTTIKHIIANRIWTRGAIWQTHRS